MTDERIDQEIKEAAMEYNQPPPTPRDRMWKEIQARRSGSRTVRRAGSPSLIRTLWPIAAAALLILGVALGRMTAPDPEGEADVVVDAPVRAEEPVETPVRPSYQIAAARYLSRAEVLLTSYSEAGAPEAMQNDERFALWARQLLTDTRLLLDSPAADDLELLVLFKDLELVLARMVQLTDTMPQSQRERLNDELSQGSLLTRLRTKIPEGALPSGT